MFKFFKEFDEEIYNEIVNEVEFNMWNDRCISIIQSEIEKIIKILFKDSAIVITNTGNDGVTYREYNPSLSRLFNEEEFKQYLVNNNILTFSDISDYWRILNVRNDKEHGYKTNKEKTKITLQIKKDSLKYLFKLCCNSYKYKFSKEPNTYWDEEYFEKLLTKPEKKFIEVEKVVEKIVEKEIKVVDNTELQKIKAEHEKLKNQFDIIIKSPNSSASNIELLKKLEIGYDCLKRKEFDNARIAFNNCRNLDITSYEAYIGFILCDYNVSSIDDLIQCFTSKNTITNNENYNKILTFCSEKNKQDLNKLKELIDANIENIRYVYPYKKAVDLYKNNQLEKSFGEFQKIYKYKDSLDYANKIYEILIKNIETNQKKSEDRYESYKKLLEVSCVDSFINKLNNLIENETDFVITLENLDIKEDIPNHITKITFNEGISLIKFDSKPQGMYIFEKKLIMPNNLREIIFPNSLEAIDDWQNVYYDFLDKLKYNELNGYKYCGNIDNPYLVLMKAENFDPENLAKTTKIIYRASVTTHLKELTIPENIKCICAWAFYSPHEFFEKYLEKINFNSKIDFRANFIYDYTKGGSFENCEKLTTIQFNNIDYIGKYEGYTFEQIIKKVIHNLRHDYIFAQKFNYYNRSTTEPIVKKELEKHSYFYHKYTKEIILNNVLTVGNFAFAGAKNLRYINLDKVNNIEYFALAGTYLHGYYNLQNVKSIGDYAFLYTFVDKIKLPTHLKTIQRGVFHSCSSLHDINLENIQKIEDSAFFRCTRLENINLDNVEFIGPDAFFGCQSIIELKFNKIKTICTQAFRECYRLNKVYISDTIENIGSRCFGSCRNLKEIYIPATIKDIGSFCFDGCYGLEKIVIYGTQKDLEKNKFLKSWIEREYKDKINFDFKEL